MRISKHTNERIETRLKKQLGFNKKKIQHMKKVVMRCGLHHPWRNQAVRIMKLNERVKLDQVKESTFGWGDELWAIIKNNVVVTIMFRNSKKPKTPRCFDNEVDLIWSYV